MAAFQLDKPNAKWLGVCAGIADRFDTDPVIVRILTVVLALCTSLVPVLLLYVLIALVAND
jgi:phage shock protein C